jgi:excisionase family DNA binding protein
MNSENGKAGWRIKEWCPQVGISRSLTYELIRDHKIKVVKLGRATIIITPPSEFLAKLGELETQ